MGFYQQWAFVILHNLDPDRVVPFLFLDALNDQVRIGRFSRWSLVKVLNIVCIFAVESKTRHCILEHEEDIIPTRILRHGLLSDGERLERGV